MGGGESGASDQFGFARSYDRLARQSLAGYDALHELAACALRCRLGGISDPRVLVVGSGTGQEFLAIDRSIPSADVTGVEPDAAMTSVAVERLGDAGIRAPVIHRCGLDAIPDTALFDAATCMLVLQFHKRGEKFEMLRTIASLVRDGGVFVLADMVGDPECEAFREIEQIWIERCVQRGLSRDEMPARIDDVKSKIGWVTEPYLLGMCEDVGFEMPVRFFSSLLVGGWIFVRRA